MNWSVKTVNQIELKWSPYWFLILGNSGFRNINLAANIPFLFTSCSRISKCLIVNCPMWSTVQNISQSRKRCFPHDSWSCPWEKYWKPFYTFFSFLFQQKIRPHGPLYGRLCRPAHFVFNAYPGRNATCPLSTCSDKNDGPRGRFNCISTVSCKGSVCVEVLTSFYGRFFVEEGQFIKYTSSTSSLHLGSHFFHLLTPPRFGALNLPEVNQFTGNCFCMVRIVLKITFYLGVAQIE